MALPKNDSSVGHSFGLEFDGITIKDIIEVSVLTMDQDVIELRQNTADGKYMVKKLPGRKLAGEVTVKRGLTSDNSFNEWRKNAGLGQMDSVRKNGAIIIYDYEGNAIRRYKLTNAWAKGLNVGPFRAGDTSPTEETLTITYEDLEAE